MFTGYGNAKDEKFKTYIQTKKDLYNKATGIPPFDHGQLMVLAKNKYKAMKELREWDAPTAQDKELIALRAEVQRMEQKRSGKKRDNKAKPTKRMGKRKAITRPNWLEKNKKPEPINEERMWKTKTYHYCCEETGGKCDGKWRIHKPSEYKGLSFLRNKAKKVGARKKLKLAKAYSTIVDKKEEEDDGDEDMNMDE